MKDPYFKKILAGLGRLDNPAAFEECARALLADAYPSLASVHGGSDAGMDGAIADGEGEAYPLVTTTSEDVARNLRRSLRSYVTHGGQRRRAVLATSRRLTPTKRRALEKIAREELDFTLVNIHEKHDFAHRLLRNSRWVRELLGITGEAPALSAVPRTRRPVAEIDLVGRDADLQWLRETRGHRLVVGQPGSGKTALLQQLVKRGSALFLASDDEVKIAEACRDFQPAIILADDAHLDPDKLVRLRQIRRDIGAEFEIVAATWLGAEDIVADALGGIGDGSIRRLELLTRAEIIQVLRSIGVSEPDDDPYLRLLVDQSANKPGLAVTLGTLWLRGEGRDVFAGKALERSLISALKQVLEHDPSQLLACFALGGDGGMSMDAVRNYLELGRDEFRRRALLESHGGVLSEHGKYLSVEPETLRSPLLAEVFFTSISLPYRELLDSAPDRGAAVEALAVAALRGVEVPRDELRELVFEGGSSRAWQALACLGESEGKWVLDHFPGDIKEVANQLLESAPGPTIQRLLHEAEAVKDPPDRRSTDPLGLLRNWVQDIPDPGFDLEGQIDEMLERRELLVKEALAYLRGGADRTVGLRACFMALSPRLESTRWAAAGGAITTRQGSLPRTTVPKMLGLWTHVVEALDGLTPGSWAELEQTLQAWMRLDRHESAGEETNRYHDVVRQIVNDVAVRARNRPGLMSAISVWADRIGLSLDRREDENFTVLLPSTDHFTAENWQEEEERQSRTAEELAERWALRPPQEVGRQLGRYQAEAQGFVSTESTATEAFFRALASAVNAPEEWLGAFGEERLRASWLRPFLERVLREKPAGWERTLGRYLDSEDYGWLAADLVIRSEGVSKSLIDAALARVPVDRVRTACLGRRIPLPTLRLLFEHENEELAIAAAAGEWLSEPRGEARPQIRAAWREAVLRSGSGGGVDLLPRASTFGLREILGSDPELGFAWLAARVESVVSNERVDSNGVYAAAIQSLASTQREELLRRLPPNGFSARLIPLLVGDSPQLYNCLLVQDRLRPYYLAPLEGWPPDAAWAELAELAVDAGHEPREIAEAAFKNSGAYISPGIDHWMKWRTAFRGLTETASEGLREVARCGLEEAEAKVSVRGVDSAKPSLPVALFSSTRCAARRRGRRGWLSRPG